MVVFLFLIFPPIIICSAAPQWSYRHQNEWPSSCKGTEQSPIDIITKNTVRKCFDDFQFNSATMEKQEITVTHSGHTVQIRFVNISNLPIVSGAGLEGEYIFESFDFHWPAEHTVNEYRYALEGQFVYYSKKYPNIQDALTHRNGVAVFAVFYEVSALTENSPFTFTQEVSLVARKINQPVVVEDPVALKDFFPEVYNEFYRYQGSLTSPNCNEGIIWTIFKGNRFILSSELDELIKIWNAAGRLQRANYRASQILHGRQVFETC